MSISKKSESIPAQRFMKWEVPRKWHSDITDLIVWLLACHELCPEKLPSEEPLSVCLQVSAQHGFCCSWGTYTWPTLRGHFQRCLTSRSRRPLHLTALCFSPLQPCTWFWPVIFSSQHLWTLFYLCISLSDSALSVGFFMSCGCF